MKRIKFGLPAFAFVLACGLAMVTGFSSFTKAKSSSTTYTERYYNTAGTLGDETAADFVYIDGETDDCTTSTTKACSAEWTTTNAPTSGQTPTQAGSPSYVTGSQTLGVYGD